MKKAVYIFLTHLIFAPIIGNFFMILFFAYVLIFINAPSDHFTYMNFIAIFIFSGFLLVGSFGICSGLILALYYVIYRTIPLWIASIAPIFVFAIAALTSNPPRRDYDLYMGYDTVGFQLVDTAVAYFRYNVPISNLGPYVFQLFSVFFDLVICWWLANRYVVNTVPRGTLNV